MDNFFYSNRIIEDIFPSLAGRSTIYSNGLPVATKVKG